MSKDQPQQFPKSSRLLRSADFEHVSKIGKRRFSKSFILIFAEQSPNPGIAGIDQNLGVAFTPTSEIAEQAKGPRIGITVSRKVGKAVIRNRVKRGIREWFRRHRDEIPAGFDYLIIARKGRKSVPDFTEKTQSVECSAKQRDAELKSLFKGPAK